MSTLFLEHLRDLRNESLVAYEKALTQRLLVEVIDKMSLAKERLREQARMLYEHVSVTFEVDLSDINRDYGDCMAIQNKLVEGLVQRRLPDVFSGMKIECTRSCRDVLVFRVFADL
jgi:hypothetical protein